MPLFLSLFMIGLDRQTYRQMCRWWGNRAPYDYIYLLNWKGFSVYSLLSRRYNEKNRLMFIFIYFPPSFFFSLNIKNRVTISIVEQVNNDWQMNLASKWKRKPWSGKTDCTYKTTSSFYQSIRQYNILNIYLFVTHVLFFSWYFDKKTDMYVNISSFAHYVLHHHQCTSNGFLTRIPVLIW
jgi:hypothetical protein